MQGRPKRYSISSPSDSAGISRSRQVCSSTGAGRTVLRYIQEAGQTEEVVIGNFSESKPEANNAEKPDCRQTDCLRELCRPGMPGQSVPQGVSGEEGHWR